MTEDERRMHERINRVEKDVDAHLIEHVQFTNMLQEGISEIKGIASSMNEIAGMVKLYKHALGFAFWTKMLGIMLIGSAAALGALAAIGAMIKYWLALP